ncbi:hypothetical protein CPB86DRAFT_187420 [Serendipita vermifera]|nr:hypothetical protein CPB86DRAFT_187420 [Serendipita vermifera]
MRPNSGKAHASRQRRPKPSTRGVEVERSTDPLRGRRIDARFSSRRQNTSEDNRDLSSIKARLDAMMRRQRESRQAYRARKMELHQSRPSGNHIVGDGNTRSEPHTKGNGQHVNNDRYSDDEDERYDNDGDSNDGDTSSDEENDDDDDTDEDMIDQAEGAVPEVVGSDTEIPAQTENVGGSLKTDLDNLLQLLEVERGADSTMTMTTTMTTTTMKKKKIWRRYYEGRKYLGYLPLQTGIKSLKRLTQQGQTRKEFSIS